jgi:RND superfamily putative drug exporter
MFARLGAAVVRFRILVLAATALFVIAAATIGATGVFGVLQGGGFDDPASESSRGADLLDERFESGQPNLVVLVTSRTGTVDDQINAEAATELVERLGADPSVDQVASYWSLGSPPPLRSEDGTRALVLARVGDEPEEAVARIREDIGGDRGPLSVEVGGAEAVAADITEQVEGDLARAESIAVPITLVLLVLVFGSLVAASLPLAVGAIAVLGTFLTLYVIGSVTDVSIFSINLTTALGLGLAIDYSLFIVSRFREELRRGLDPHAAVVRTVDTAGRTVAFSALTVAVSLAALIVFPLYFLRSFAYAGIAVVLLAMLASLFSLPALLAVLGHRVDALRLWRRAPRPAGTGFWYRMAKRVQRRPLPIAAVVVVILLLLGMPFLNVVFGVPDDRVLPTEAESRRVSDLLRTEFQANESEGFPVVVDGVAEVDAGARGDDIAALAVALSSDPDVARVDALTGVYVDGSQVVEGGPASSRFLGDDAVWLNVVPAVEAVSPEGEALVERLREVAAASPLDDVLVSGRAAELVDSKEAIFSRAPIAGLWIAVTTFVLLFLSFGSLLVPLKAIVLNVLSLTATFGAMVWIFQEGNGAGLLDFTATGTLDTTMPILMFCIAFGLSMDYEVFLLSRIKEEHDRTGDNDASVALGLDRTGRIVTAAAAVLSVTFLAFASSGITFIKLMGLGMALAIVMDATVIRGVLVPAFMKLAGNANWWAPSSLRRLQRRIGFHDGPSEPPVPATAPPVDSFPQPGLEAVGAGGPGGGR